jgi:MFS-type transporter involved in bile tolerance (Atg22 family)
VSDDAIVTTALNSLIMAMGKISEFIMMIIIIIIITICDSNHSNRFITILLLCGRRKVKWEIFHNFMVGGEYMDIQ